MAADERWREAGASPKRKGYRATGGGQLVAARHNVGALEGRRRWAEDERRPPCNAGLSIPPAREAICFMRRGWRDDIAAATAIEATP